MLLTWRHCAWLPRSQKDAEAKLSSPAILPLDLEAVQFIGGRMEPTTMGPYSVSLAEPMVPGTVAIQSRRARLERFQITIMLPKLGWIAQQRFWHVERGRFNRLRIDR